MFTGDSMIEVCSKHLSAVPESPSAVLGRDIDAGLEALILRCLEKRPDDRPRDGAVLAREIEQLPLAGWTVSDARAWWREFREGREGPIEGRPTERTQLAVNVEGRR